MWRIFKKLACEYFAPPTASWVLPGSVHGWEQPQGTDWDHSFRQRTHCFCWAQGSPKKQLLPKLSWSANSSAYLPYRNQNPLLWHTLPLLTITTSLTSVATVLTGSLTPWVIFTWIYTLKVASPGFWQLTSEIQDSLGVKLPLLFSKHVKTNFLYLCKSKIIELCKVLLNDIFILTLPTLH